MLKAFARFRPVNPIERSSSSLGVSDLDLDFFHDSVHLHTDSLDRTIPLSGCLPPTSTQSEVYDLCVRPIVEKAFLGVDTNLLVYGAAGTGKRFTLQQGLRLREDDRTLRGIIPRLAEHLFDHVSSCLRSSTETTGSLSVILLLPEKPPLDLLSPTRANVHVQTFSKPEGNVFDGSTRLFVRSSEDFLRVVRMADRAYINLMMLGSGSTRSLIYEIRLVQFDRILCRSLRSVIRLVESSSNEIRLRQRLVGHDILSNCLGALALGEEVRETMWEGSHLTRILSDSFRRETNLSVLLCCSPHGFSLDSTIETLRIGELVQSVGEVSIRPNVVLFGGSIPQARKDTLLVALLSEIEEQRQLTDEEKEVRAGLPDTESYVSSLVVKNAQLKAQTMSMKDQIESLNHENRNLSEVVEQTKEDVRLLEEQVDKQSSEHVIELMNLSREKQMLEEENQVMLGMLEDYEVELESLREAATLEVHPLADLRTPENALEDQEECLAYIRLLRQKAMSFARQSSAFDSIRQQVQTQLSRVQIALQERTQEVERKQRDSELLTQQLVETESDLEELLELNESLEEELIQLRMRHHHRTMECRKRSLLIKAIHVLIPENLNALQEESISTECDIQFDREYADLNVHIDQIQLSNEDGPDEELFRPTVKDEVSQDSMAGLTEQWSAERAELQMRIKSLELQLSDYRSEMSNVSLLLGTTQPPSEPLTIDLMEEEDVVAEEEEQQRPISLIVRYEHMREDNVRLTRRFSTLQDSARKTKRLLRLNQTRQVVYETRISKLEEQVASLTSQLKRASKRHSASMKRMVERQRHLRREVEEPLAGASVFSSYHLMGGVTVSEEEEEEEGGEEE